MADGERVLELAGRVEKSLAEDDVRRERLQKACEILRQVLLQDVEPGDKGEGSKRLRNGSSGDRICSVQDPEMRHGRKSSSNRFDGHKTQVVSDVETGLVTAVAIMEGSAKDEQGSLELVQEASATTGLEIEAALGDCAYGSGENRERFEQAGIKLLAKVPKQARSEYFNKDDFKIDLDSMSCCCPAGQTTTKVVKAGWQQTATGKRVQLRAFSFSAKVCAACPLRAQCFKQNSHGRQVHLHPHEAKMQAARAWQRSPEFDQFRKERQVIEHRIARLVQLGIRQARYTGHRKVLFQLLMAATVANLTLVAGKSGEMYQRSRAGAVQAVLSVLAHPLRLLAGRVRACPRFIELDRVSSALRTLLCLPVLKMAPSRPGL